MTLNPNPRLHNMIVEGLSMPAALKKIKPILAPKS
jgi:hypothetical protein